MRRLLRTLWLRSLLVAIGLSCGHWIWTGFAVAYDEQLRAHLDAYAESEEAVEARPIDVELMSWSHARWLWASATTESWLLGRNSPGWIGSLLRVLTAWFIVWPVRALVRLIVRVRACGGVGGLGSPLDLTQNERVAPGWAVVAASPLYSLLAACATALFEGFMQRSDSLTLWQSCSSIFGRAESDTLSIALFVVVVALCWGVLASIRVKRQRARRHRSWELCSCCGYEFAGHPTLPCPECASYPPRVPRDDTRLEMTRLVLVLPLLGILAGFLVVGEQAALWRSFFWKRDAYGVWMNPVCVPPGRIVIASGEWGDLYLVSVVTEAGGIVVRSVLYPSDFSDECDEISHVGTVQIDQGTGCQVLTMIPEIDSNFDGCELRVTWYGWPWGMTRAWPVEIYGIASKPVRVVSYPGTWSETPEPIREFLDAQGPSVDWFKKYYEQELIASLASENSSRPVLKWFIARLLGSGD